MDLKKLPVRLASLLVFVIVVNSLIFFAPFNCFKKPAVQALLIGVFIEGGSHNEPPATNAFSETIHLPDHWHKRGASKSSAWYRFEFAYTHRDQALSALYIPMVAHNMKVLLNGIVVGVGGNDQDGFNDPLNRYHNSPQMYVFPSELLRENNEVLVYVKTVMPEKGLLSPIYIGGVDELLPHYTWKAFVRVEGIKLLTAVMFVLAIVIFSFWLARPQDKIYLTFAIELLLWGGHNFNLFINNIPTSTLFWEALNITTLGWTVSAMLIFNHQYVGYSAPKVEKAIISFSMLGVLMFFLPSVEWVFRIGYVVWDSFLLIVGGYAIATLIKIQIRRVDNDSFLMLFAGTPILACGFHDILVVNNLWNPFDGLFLQYSVVLPLIVFGWFLVKRFALSIREAESLASTLDERVKIAETKIKHQYMELKALEEQRILSTERERIMRDMHDGIGGQLVSVLLLLQGKTGEVFTSITNKVQNSLIDLRLVIDSLDPTITDIESLLGTLRSRLEPQINAANKKLVWDVGVESYYGTDTPQKLLHTMRIIQEAVNNCIKHATGDLITLSTRYDAIGKVYLITIKDNGIGVAVNNNLAEAQSYSKQGRGIKNMIFRAQEIGAKLECNILNSGFEVRLILPTKKKESY